MQRTIRSTWARRVVEGTLVLAFLAVIAVMALLIDSPGSTAAPDGPVALPAAAPVRPNVGWVTSPTDDGRRLEPIASTDEIPTRRVVVDVTDRRQTWVGAGAALTDASTTLLEDHPAAVDLLFAPGADEGARLNVVRLPLSATDFSTRAWTWAHDTRTGRVRPSQPALRSLDVLDEIGATVGADLVVPAAAWRAPRGMTVPTADGGQALAPGAELEYADMLGAQAAWLVERGVPLASISLGNEPGHTADYPSMLISDDQAVTMARALSIELDGLGVDLAALDHNWDDRVRLDAMVAGAPGAFDVAAFHCYGGEPSAMADSPVPVMVTECTGTTDNWISTFGWDARVLVDQSIEHGSTGLVMWNLALDPDHGPKRDWGCADCRGLLTIDPSTGAATTGPEFYVLAHLTRAAPAGSVVVASTSEGDISTAAFLRPDGTVGVVGHNDTGERQVLSIERTDGTELRVAVGPWELFTVDL
jgi:glucosylceramidase